MRTLGWVGAMVMSLGLVLGACANDSRGTECTANGDCDDGEMCVPLAVCADEASCVRSCELPCGSDEDCGGATCALRADTFICQ